MIVFVHKANGKSMPIEDVPNNSPRLWVFMSIILGVLGSIILTASLISRILQRHRRLSLQRRIESGEVDLEMLGVRNLRASQHVLDKMPLYAYGKDEQGVESPHGQRVQEESKSKRASLYSAYMCLGPISSTLD